MPDALARPEQPAFPISFATSIIRTLLQSAVLDNASRALLEAVRAPIGQMEAKHA
ncbi:hypothetical protein [Ralstonia pseudosolanacearum]|uniref:hypothetical protein n=1 Tax=Ralstonia pseudosolanacearum TaxID=1310165 RepID=UPI0012FDE5D2|nr:hypothetical protein [Ralstonia pseudosolanacearum]UYR02411.1 hypothetical protein NQS37_02940 [Ralstonia pseudosolanacearum]